MNENRDIKPELLKFNFNSADMFNPDQDSQKVAQTIFDWIMNPIEIKQF